MANGVYGTDWVLGYGPNGMEPIIPGTQLPYGGYVDTSQGKAKNNEFESALGVPLSGGAKSSSASRGPSSAAELINSMYAAREQAALNALKSAYDQNVLTLNAAGERIPADYQDARNRTAAMSEIQRANFNEFAAGRGLNSGAGSQAHLSFSNALLGNLSGITAAEANAKADLALQRARLESAYTNDVAKAVADGDLAKAQALYNDFLRVDNAIVSLYKAT